MNRVLGDAENAHSSSVESCPSLRDVHSINPTQLVARIESYEGREKKGISDVRRTFCLFVTFDLLFITLLWIIELNVKGGIETTLEKEVLQYDYSSSYFDIFLLAVFRFKVLILAYAMCRLRHWWAIAFTTAVTSAFLLAKVIISQLFSQGAFGYVLPIISFILAWIETWFLDFKVLPQEAEEENRFLIAQDASERAALLHSGVLSDGQFYSPPESAAGSDEESEEKQDSEKPVV
ncbi:MLN64 N-terminal domain [Dryobates pubescens]|uniref:MLN64 N-terminal domain n=1 Tax=Dryobates pubescens TaxID=118200 RepID=A0A093GD80_DRYPU|nr:STARD3 N-terminal-like protein isoform X1 [Dryobates pubescens]XP_054033134.1 STARD3 N-terminal-like protein isoform X1 [Dryobates pubescens]KFV67158.1 MLN64 N-terminal domain [Dryobates pubescens]